jgi:hypothetical protein
MKFDIWAFVSENCWERSSFITNWQEQQVLYMKANTHFWSYFAQAFLQWQTLYRNPKHTLFVELRFFKKRVVYEIMWTNIGEPDRLQLTIWRMCFACGIPKPPPPHTHTHTHTHTHYLSLSLSQNM